MHIKTLSDACNLLSNGKVKTECLRAQLLQSCPTQWDPIDCSPPGSSVHGILQARVLEWVAISFSRGSSRPTDWTCVSSIYMHWQVGSLPLAPPGKPRGVLLIPLPSSKKDGQSSNHVYFLPESLINLKSLCASPSPLIQLRLIPCACPIAFKPVSLF